MNDRTLFYQHIAQTSPAPLGLKIVHSEGLYLVDDQGNKYKDLISGIGPSLLGHQHPAIKNAIKSQTEKYLHTLVYGEFILSPQTQLAYELLRYLPASLNNIYYLSTGTEATELAMKLAKRYTGRSEIAAVEKSYHGSTQGSMSLMSEAYFTSKFRPLIPQIRYIRWNNIDDLERINSRTAAVIMEVVKAETGIQVPNPTYLEAIRKRCNETGALLVFDEIQSAYARTGSLFAFQKYGILPDILLLGKSFGGGLPLSACISSHEIMSTLANHPVLGHITTFGGHPLACASGLATLQTLISDRIMDTIPTKEQRFRQNLRHPEIVELRSAGLWLGIELSTEQKLQQAIQKCLERGIITDWFLFNSKTMRIAPPLIISIEEIDEACEAILKVLDHI